MLNCFYKCISRAFAARLKKYMNKLTPCCQKGYANGRYCQEVLKSVIDTIEKCRHLNKKGGVLCLDINPLPSGTLATFFLRAVGLIQHTNEDDIGREKTILMT